MRSTLKYTRRVLILNVTRRKREVLMKQKVYLHPDETWDRHFKQLNRIEDLIGDCGLEITKIGTEQVFQSKIIQKILTNIYA